MLIPQTGSPKAKGKRGVVSGEEACLVLVEQSGTSGLKKRMPSRRLEMQVGRLEEGFVNDWLYTSLIIHVFICPFNKLLVVVIRNIAMNKI